MNFNLIGTKEGLRGAVEQADADWQIEQVNHIRNRCRSILREPTATPEDRKVAEAMLDFFKDAPQFTDAEHRRMDESRIADLDRAKGCGRA